MTRRSLHGGSKEEKKGEIAIVKDIDKAYNVNEQKVKVRFEGAKQEDAIYVPKKFARYLKPEHVYEFFFEKEVFRGSSQSRFGGASMLRRTKAEPKECRNSGFGGSRMGGSSGGGFGGF